MENDEDDIPAVLPLDKPLTWRDALAMASSLLWMVLCMMPGIEFFARKKPFESGGITLCVHILLFALIAGGGAIVGKYGWLYLMSFVVGKADVGPLVAYGIPRRISRFDRRFIRKHFRR